MYGTSYAAHAQANAAKLRPPHLETIVVNIGGLSNGWDHRNPQTERSNAAAHVGVFKSRF